MLKRVRARRWLLCLVALGLIGASSTTAIQSGGGNAGNPALAWTGTVTVETRGAGPMAPTGDASKIRFTGMESVTYTLRGDGTAGWTATASNTTDMAGLATIPTRGSGSGHGRGSVTFNGQSWDIAVESEDEYPTTTDMTAWDKVFAENVFGWAIAMAKAMGHALPSGDHVEHGRLDPSGASVVAAGAASAATLSGSERYETESTHIGGFNGVSATVTVTWNLRRTPVPPRVRIYGPECGCIDGDATETSLHFIAGASPAGGEFSEFIVTSNGPMPDVTSNEGGEQASLDLTGTKDTGTVTLKIRYTRNGVRTESAPFTVNFCRIDPIELADNTRDIGFDLDGRLVVDAKTKVWRGGKEVTGELEWELEKMGAPTTLEADPSSRTAEQIEFTYVTMPGKNSDFGPKTLTARTKGTCACERRDTIRAFYPDVDSNHPDDGTPNWYYYWKQTAAVPPLARAWLKYQESIVDPFQPGRPIARYDHASQKILISGLVFGPSACRDEVTPGTETKTGRHAVGIDCFAETVRHELQHRTDAIDWWGGPSGPYGVDLSAWFLGDWDHDQVPNEVETLLTGCKPGTKIDLTVDVLKLLTLREKDDLIERGKQTWFTCAQRPFSDATDAEINAYWKGWTWPIGSVDAEDWSCGDLSKQWKGKKCGR